MRHLAIGDLVNVGGSKFSEVFMFTHQDASIMARFVNLTVASGEHVVITPNHYMYGGEGMKLAGDMQLGQVMQMFDGRLENVVRKEYLVRRGLYNPQTMQGDVVVNGFRASTYTKYVQKEMAHSLLAPLRAFYRICGAHISGLF